MKLLPTIYTILMLASNTLSATESTHFSADLDSASTALLGAYCGEPQVPDRGFRLGEEFVKLLAQEIKEGKPERFDLGWKEPLRALFLLDKEGAPIAAFGISIRRSRMILYPIIWSSEDNAWTAKSTDTFKGKGIASERLYTQLERARVAHAKHEAEQDAP